MFGDQTSITNLNKINLTLQFDNIQEPSTFGNVLLLQREIQVLDVMINLRESWVGWLHQNVRSWSVATFWTAEWREIFKFSNY